MTSTMGRLLVLSILVGFFGASSALANGAPKGLLGPRKPAARPAPERGASRGEPKRTAAPSSLGRAPTAARDGRSSAASGGFHLEALAERGEYRAPTTLSRAQVEQGLHLNRVQVELHGSSHFGGWWDVVKHNTEFVIAQGTAYAGHSVSVGGQTYKDAAIIYRKEEAGNETRTHLDVAGTAGEKVRVVYWRTAPTTTFKVSGSHVEVGNLGQHQAPAGDLHWRDVLLPIQKTEGAEAKPTRGHFDYHQPDAYNGAPTGVKGTNYLGGDATDARAASRTVTKL